MARFVVLLNWTDQGVKNAKESVQRVEQARAMFKEIGVEIESIYWTIGSHDLVAVLTAHDGETLTVALLRLAKSGNVRSTTLRAFDAQEMGAILTRVE